MMSVESRWVSRLLVNRLNSRDLSEALVFHNFFISVSILLSLSLAAEWINFKAAPGILSQGEVNAKSLSNESENMPRIYQGCLSGYEIESKGRACCIGNQWVLTEPLSLDVCGFSEYIQKQI